MKYLLDSNVLIAVALASDEGIQTRAAQCDEGDLVTSAIAYAEVLYGTIRDKPPPIAKLKLLTEEVAVLPFDDRAAQAYARLPLKRSSYDQLIAAHALSLGLTVVTSNERHFTDVPGLKVENWTA